MRVSDASKDSFQSHMRTKQIADCMGGSCFGRSFLPHTDELRSDFLSTRSSDTAIGLNMLNSAVLRRNAGGFDRAIPTRNEM